MWHVTFDEHHRFHWFYSTSYRTKRYWVAWFFYQWWTFRYIMSPFSVKQVSLYWSQDGILSIQGGKSISSDRKQLAVLRYEKEKRDKEDAIQGKNS